MILASNNAHKLEEFRAIFADMGIEIIPQSAAGCHFEVDETGETFEENAYLKAIAVTRATGQPAVADDSGLMVDALGGAPGVHSARYAGEPCDDAANNAKLLAALGNVPDAERAARFASTLVFVDEDGSEIVAEGTVEGRIGHEGRGSEGFGYDPLFLPDVFGGARTLAEVDRDEKNAVSHRGNALRQLRAKLQEAGGANA